MSQLFRRAFQRHAGLTRFAVFGFVAAATLFFGHSVHAATCTYISTVSSDFNTDTNWDCGFVPGATSTAVIPTATSTSLSAPVTVGQLLINTSATLTTTGFDLTVNGTSTLTGELVAGSNTTTLGGSADFRGGTFTPGNGTLRFASSTAIAFADIYADGSLTVSNLVIGPAGSVGYALNTLTDLHVTGTYSGDATFSFISPSTFTVDGRAFLNVNLLAMNGASVTAIFNATTTIASGATLLTANDNVTFNSDVINSGAIGDGADTGTLFTFNKGWTQNAFSNFYSGSSTVAFAGSVPQTIPADVTFWNLTASSTGSTVTLGGNVTSTNDLTITSGTLNLGGNSLFVGGNWSDSGTLTPAGGTVDFNGNGPSSQNIGAEANFNIVTIDKLIGTATLTGNATTSKLNLTSGAFDQGSATLHIEGTGLAGSRPFLITAGTFTPSADPTKYVYFDGAAGTDIEATTYNAIQFGGAGPFTLIGETTSTNTVIDAAATLGAGTFTWNVLGSWSDSGVFTGNTGLVRFRGATSDTLSGEAGFYDLVIDKGAGALTANGGNVTSTHDVTLASGTLNLATRTLFVGRNWTNSGGALGTGGSGGTVSFDGTGAQSIGAESDFKNLTINKTAGVATLTGGVTSTADLSIPNVNGKLALGTNTLNVGGNWSAASGTLQGDTGTVNFNGTAQSISGSVAFFNLTKRTTATDTLTFQSGATTTVTGTLTLQGAASNRLSLVASASPAQWYIDPEGTRTVSYVDVSDSDNVNALVVNAGATSLDSGNNINWSVDITRPVISITVPTTASSTAITDTTIRVTDNIGLSSSAVSVASSTAGTASLSCSQTSSTQVDCTISITSSGNLVVDARDLGLNSATQTSATGYAIDAVAPVITITAPTLTSSSTISNTTIRVTDNVGLPTTTISVASSTAGTSNLNCTQTSSTQVDCTIDITSNGDLMVDAADSVGNAAVQVSSTGYTFDTTAPSAPAESPAAGSYTTAQSVELTTNDATATIRYTTDGTTPSCTAGTLYSGAFSVSATETITSIACDAVSNPSALSIDTFTIGGSSGGSGGGGGGGSGGIAAHGYAVVTPTPTSTTPVTPPVTETLPTATVLDPSNLSNLLAALNVTEKFITEDAVLRQVKADAVEFGLTLTVDQAMAIRNFIVYGISPATIKFGQGERRAISRDYMDTVHRPDYIWTDIDRMSNGQIPLQRNLTRERQQVTTALPVFQRLFGHMPNFKNATENLAWNTLLYRIRFPRDLVKERVGLQAYISIYRHNPTSPFSWAVVRVLGYVK